ncbi:outer membrane beta-barrel protein [Pedobacter sp. NJ-S-72]
MVSSIHTFTINSSVNAELSANYQSAQVFGTYITKPIYVIDLGISKSFANKKANIKLSASDLFNTRQINVKSAHTITRLQSYPKTGKPDLQTFIFLQLWKQWR